jgi:hypothetical protein
MSRFSGLRWFWHPDCNQTTPDLPQRGIRLSDMASSPVKKSTGNDTGVAESSTAFKPGRQVGWIFKNGEVVAIERHECDARNDEEAS